MLVRFRDDAPRLSAKGYPESMVKFYLSKADEIALDVEKAKQVYADHVVLADEGDTPKTANVEAVTQCIEKAMSALEQSKKAFESHYGADLKKLL